MRIISTTIVSHEVDILEAFVRHHAPMCELMVMILKRSPPSVREILTALQKEGITLDIRESSDQSHWHPETHSALLHELHTRMDPDWIIPLDCDEFLRSTDSQPLSEALAALPDSVVSLPWQTYIPRPEDDAKQPHILLRMQHRREREPVPYAKVMVPRSLLRNTDAVFAIGAHSFLERSDGPAYPAATRHDVALAHFPIRNAPQVAAKAFTGWLSHASYPHRQPGGAFQWKQLFDRCKQHMDISPAELRDLALNYAIPESVERSDALVRDPVVAAPPALRFPHADINPVMLLAEAAEDLALRLSQVPRDFTD